MIVWRRFKILPLLLYLLIKVTWLGEYLEECSRGKRINMIRVIEFILYFLYKL
ncbi:hypothetical protein HanXRQr2_Chr01g0003031 [Helianthus annuus]|uniref:Uncharacterized protein n=1 Tax=Helianthus annuus TaxID=4232 RepID=A0A251VLY3_HELAN|nr:hypothetical protein HanXRQr2_Chr01g0003031 [Helianthus annuus]